MLITPTAAATSTLRRRNTQVASWAALSNGLVLLVASAVFSRFATTSAVLAGMGIVLVAPSLPAAARLPWVKAAIVVVAGWMMYGAAIGSLPSPSDVGSWSSFATSEGRAILPFVVLAGASALPSRRAVDVTLTRSIKLLVVSAAAALALDAAGSAAVGGVRLFHGFTSGHHVPGFLYGLGIVYILVRRPFAAGAVHWASLGVLLAAVVSSGSRASIVGLGAVALYWAARHTRVSLLERIVAVVAVGALLLAASPRFRDTLTSLGTSRILSSAQDLFESRDNVNVRSVAQSGAEANVLNRFGLYGEALDDFRASPFIGRGIYRFNDVDTQKTGVEGLIHVDVRGVRVHSDLQAHNMILQLLSETGLIGTLGFLGVWVLPWRWTRFREPDGDAAEYASLLKLTTVFSFAVGFTSAALLTAGLGVIAALLIGSCARACTLPYTAADAKRT